MDEHPNSNVLAEPPCNDAARETPARDSLRNEAHRLLELGYTALPANAAEKRPLVAWKKFQAAQLTAEELDRLFDDCPEFTGIGIVTNGIVVLDLDAMPDGSPNPFPEDPDCRMDLSVAPAVETPRGGLHRYFRAPTDIEIKNSAGKIAAGVDVRSAGGFLMVPPSVRGVRGYEWQGGNILNVSPNQLPDLPQFLLELLTATAPAERHGRVPLDGLIVEGERNDTLFRLASRWRGQGLDQDQILILLRNENVKRCRSPLGEAELASIAESASKYPP
jgi:hypothetical protein